MQRQIQEFWLCFYQSITLFLCFLIHGVSVWLQYGHVIETEPGFHVSTAMKCIKKIE